MWLISFSRSSGGIIMKTTKKCISLLLAMLMLVSSLSAIAFAADSYDHLPQIYVEGLDSKPIYYKDDPNKKPLFYPIDTEMIFGNLLKYEDNIRLAIESSDPNLLTAYLYEWLYSCYGMTALGKDGYDLSLLRQYLAKCSGFVHLTRLSTLPILLGSYFA